jgi:hypothetical protein
MAHRRRLVPPDLPLRRFAGDSGGGREQTGVKQTDYPEPPPAVPPPVLTGDGRPSPIGVLLGGAFWTILSVTVVLAVVLCAVALDVLLAVRGGHDTLFPSGLLSPLSGGLRGVLGVGLTPAIFFYLWANVEGQDPRAEWKRRALALALVSGGALVIERVIYTLL